MFTKTINLQKACEVCGNNTYTEDESGYYVCQTCGVVSQMRCADEMEIDAFGLGLSKLKSKNIDHNSSDYDDVDENFDLDNGSVCNSSMDDENETNIYTNVNTRQTSRAGDNSSVWSRKSSRSKNIKIEKSLNEILLDGQRNFQNIFNTLGAEFGGKLSQEEKKELIETTKENWFDYIKNEYDIQENNENSLFGRGRRMNLKVARSRTNTIDEVENKNYFASKSLDAKKTKRKIKEQMITRRVKSRNVLCAYDNEDDTKNTSRKELYKKFIEEYDQVVNFIRTDDVIREKCKLSNFDLSKVTHTISYEQIIKICIMLNINLSQSDKNSFEDLIHKIFLSQSLNYQTTHSYSFDSQRSTLTGDFYLSILYRSFNSLRKFPLVSYELENKFKSFDSIRSLSISDLKMFRYFNYEKYIKLINQIDKNDFFLFHRAELILKYIIIDILNCKQEFFDMCVRILNKIKPRVIKFMGKIYAIEHICLGVFLFALKIFYGLNDLPYLSLFSALVKNNNFSFNNDLVNKFIDAYDKITKGDKLCDVYRNNRTQIDVINRLNELSEKKEDNEILTVNVQLKKNFTNEFKEKYLKIYYECILRDVENSYSLKNINELHSKFMKFKTKQTPSLFQPTFKVKFSEKFLKKKQSRSTVNNSNKINSFFSEEIDFYNTLTDSTEVEFPLPCDTYVRYQRHAHKFEGVDYKNGELVMMYFISKYFKVDFSSLKSLLKFTERVMENEPEEA